MPSFDQSIVLLIDDLPGRGEDATARGRFSIVASLRATFGSTFSLRTTSCARSCALAIWL